MVNINKQADALVPYSKTRNPFEIANHLKITVKYGDFTQLKGFYNYAYRKCSGAIRRVAVKNE
jgi:hypothetical protein